MKITWIDAPLSTWQELVDICHMLGHSINGGITEGFPNSDKKFMDEDKSIYEVVAEMKDCIVKFDEEKNCAIFVKNRG